MILCAEKEREYAPIKKQYKRKRYQQFLIFWKKAGIVNFRFYLLMTKKQKKIQYLVIKKSKIQPNLKLCIN